MWADEFSAGGLGARGERINRSIVGMTGTAPREIDFRIKMPDPAGRGLLWEDKVVPPAESETSEPEQSDETTGKFGSGVHHAKPSCALPGAVPSNGTETARTIMTTEIASPLPRVVFF